ncbi:hypothetical protein BC830DRAFT_1150960 [Chytriomyces sp. MP71]|nr:hypothetical protein BC830DRAFT_1150960 [Chytriomyces sp. MP71]
MSVENESRLDMLSIPITCTILGVCLDDSLCAVVRVGRSLSEDSNLPAPQRKMFLKLTLFVFNIALSLNSVFLIWQFFTDASGCFPVTLSQSITFHIFMTVFDGYMLYKSSLVLGNFLAFQIVACLCILYRTTWAVVDIVLSNLPVVWDPAANMCVFLPCPLSTLNYTLGDVMADVVSTFATIMAFVRQGGFEMDRYGLSFQLVKEAALRSALCLGLDTFFLLFVYQWSGSAQNISYAVQNLIYLKLINLELMWKGVRDRQHMEATRRESRNVKSEDTPTLTRSRIRASENGAPLTESKK